MVVRVVAAASAAASAAGSAASSAAVAALSEIWLAQQSARALARLSWVLSSATRWVMVSVVVASAARPVWWTLAPSARASARALARWQSCC